MKFSKFFSNIQEQPWYRQFLNPVIDQIEPNSDLLDIGTGPAKMLQILFEEKHVNSIGLDTNQEMLDEAQNKIKNTSIELFKITPGESLQFNDNRFDTVSYCNVLFHLDHDAIDQLLMESKRVLRENGQIIVLTPTGRGNLLKLSAKYLSPKNLGIYVWYRATKNKSLKWSKDQYLEKYAQKNKLGYKKEIIMNGFAQIEILKIL